MTCPRAPGSSYTSGAMAGPPPSVDVILPTLCAGAWVHEAIASVLAQSHPVRRLLVVDDASPDGSADAIAARWGEAGGRGGVEEEKGRRGAVAWERLDRGALLRECFAHIGIRLVAALVRRDAFEA